MSTNNNNDEEGRSLKNIWLLTTGSRGDIQPYISVCVALQKRGYKVTFFTSKEFVPFAQSFGMDGVSIRESNEKLLFGGDSDGDDDGDDDNNAKPVVDTKILDSMVNGDAFTLLKGLDEINVLTASMTCKAVEKAYETNPPDLCLATPLTRGICWSLAIKYRVPFVELSCQTMSYNPNYMMFGLPTLPFGLHYYLFKYSIIPSGYDMAVGFCDCMGVDIKKLYPKQKFVDSVLHKAELPLIVLFSPTLASCLHPNTQAMTRFVGTTVIEKEEQCAHLDEFGGADTKKRMEDFLNAGSKPIYLGWGSMISKSPEYMVEFCVRAIHHSKQRAIVLGGVAKLSLQTLKDAVGVSDEIYEYAKNNILFVDKAPHEWLFPTVKATIHHGGAGTTTAALRAGVPTIITPVFVDQFDHSYLVRKFKIGVGFEKQLQKITWEELGSAITKVVSCKEISKNAFDLGTKLRSEDGANNAANEIESFWQNYCVNDKFHNIFPGNGDRGHIEEKKSADHQKQHHHQQRSATCTLQSTFGRRVLAIAAATSVVALIAAVAATTTTTTTTTTSSTDLRQMWK